MVNKAKNSRRKRLRGKWREQWRYAWNNVRDDMLRQPLATLLTIMVIAIALTLPSVCYIIWKNVNTVATQWYPTPQLTVYLDKTLNDDATVKVLDAIKTKTGVGQLAYLSRDQTLSEFRHWSGFGTALDMLEENPLPAVVVVTPQANSLNPEMLNALRDRVAEVSGVDEVRMEDSWFARLSALTQLVGQVAAMIGILMIVAVFLVIGNSVRLSIFSRRDAINVMKLIGATDGFILQPFLNGGAMLGFLGAMLSLLLSGALAWRMESMVSNVATVFATTFHLLSFGWDEALLLILTSTMIGWIAAWLATVQHLRRFTPQ